MRAIYLVPLLSLTPHVAAWGAVGHEITATIAQMYLFPSTHDALCSILPSYAKCHLAPVAAWADKIKWQMRWSSQLHFVNAIGDHPGDHCVFGQQGWQGAPGVNVLSGIQNTTTWLREGKAGAEEALKFLVHFVGDLHQPLHLVGRNKGGNGDLVHWDNRQQKFHAVWDNFIIAKGVRTVPFNYTRPLSNPHVEGSLLGAIYDPYIRQIAWEGLLNQWAGDLESWAHCPPHPSTPLAAAPSGQIPLAADIPQTDDATVCPFFWAAPTHALNCQIVWPPELTPDNHPAIELDTPQYWGRLHDQRLVERLLAQGGIRLAAILNSVFGNPNETRMRPLATDWAH